MLMTALTIDGGSRPEKLPVYQSHLAV